MFLKYIFDKSYKFIESHSLIIVKNTSLILPKENFNVNEFVNSSIKDVNKNQNIYFKLEKNRGKEFDLFLYLFCEIMFCNFFQFIIIDNINEAEKNKKFVRGEERRREEKRGEERKREEKRGEERRREENFFYWKTRGDSAKLPFRTRKWPF